MDLYGNKLVNMIETKLLCVTSSNLADTLVVMRGWTLLILEVRYCGIIIFRGGSIFVVFVDINNNEAPVTKRRGIGPIRTEISPYKIRKKLFIFQIVRFNGICIWQNYFCILPNFGDFGAKTSLFRYLINQKRNKFIKHCSPLCINKPPISEMYIYIYKT